MDLQFDHRKFRNLFHNPLKAKHPEWSKAGPIFCIVNSQTVVYATDGGTDFSEWKGVTLQDFQKEFEGRQIIVRSSDDLMSAFSAGAGLKSLLDQETAFRQKLGFDWKVPLGNPMVTAWTQSKWIKKVIPKEFGVFLRLEGDDGKEFLWVNKGTQFEVFQVPDLSVLPDERRLRLADCSRFLADKYRVPILSVKVPLKIWQNWITSLNPWLEILDEVERGRAEVYPNRLKTRLLFKALALRNRKG